MPTMDELLAMVFPDKKDEQIFPMSKQDLEKVINMARCCVSFEKAKIAYDNFLKVFK